MASEVDTRTVGAGAPVHSYSPRYWPGWACGIIALGTVLRLRQFFTDRSLWFDEAALALNVIHRSFAGLFKPLDYHQGAPVGFLVLEKLASKLIGTGEVALRTLPLIAGIAALFVFFQVAKLYVSGKAVPLALFLFAVCDSLVYYSSEAKQYSSDVLITLLLLWTAVKIASSSLTTSRLVGFGVAGALAVWFSHSASLVLAGVGVTLLVAAAKSRDWPRVTRLLSLLAVWAASFAACYVLSLRPLSHDAILLNYWGHAFPPHSDSFLAMLSWLSDKFIAAFADPASLFPIVGAALFCAGCWQMMRRRRIAFWLVVTPLLMLLLASLVHRYPLQGRLLLFITPILLLVISEGAIWIYEITEPFSRLVGMLVLALLLLRPAYLAANALNHPRKPDNIKPVLRYIETHENPGDVLYVYYGGEYQLAYYSNRYSLPAQSLRKGADCGADAACYAADIEALRGSPRTWIVLSHILIDNNVDEGEILTDQLDRIGTQLQSFQASGSRAFLYDLSNRQRVPELHNSKCCKD